MIRHLLFCYSVHHIVYKQVKSLTFVIAWLECDIMRKHNKCFYLCLMTVTSLLFLSFNGCVSTDGKMVAGTTVVVDISKEEIKLLMTPPWNEKHVDFYLVDVNKAEKVNPPSEVAGKLKDIQPPGEGAGYLSEGPTVSIGVMDGEEELKVLDKIKKIERKLKAEVEKQQDLEQKLQEAIAAKAEVKRELSDKRMEIEEVNRNMSDEIKALEDENKDLEERASAAEQEAKRLKKQLIKAQIAETRSQQELFKLRIKNLNKDQE